MSRPQKYDWNSIRNAYEAGISKHEISKIFKIEIKQLNNKIHKESWVVIGNISNDISAIKGGFMSLSGTIAENPKLENIIIDRVNTIFEDNGIMIKNRRLIDKIQDMLLNNIHEINMKNIQQVTSSIKNMEYVANPRPDTQINNNVEIENPITLIKVEYAE